MLTIDTFFDSVCSVCGVPRSTDFEMGGGAEPESSKMGQYHIKDNFLAFWFRFIAPNRSFIESGHKEIALKRIQDSLVPNHAAYVYEDICRQTIWDMIADGRLPTVYDRVGRWWSGKTAEIDVVALDTTEEKDILFGECKFHENVPVEAEVFFELKEKAKYVNWGTENRRETYILFSVSGYTQGLQELAAQRNDLVLA